MNYTLQQKFLKQFQKVFFVVFFFALIMIITPVALADAYGLEITANQGYSTTVTSNSNIPTSVPETIGKVVGAGLAFVGAIFLILIIFAGFMWMFARGNEAEVTKARDLIISAIIGLVIVLAAYAITKYVGGIVGQ